MERNITKSKAVVLNLKVKVEIEVMFSYKGYS